MPKIVDDAKIYLSVMQVVSERGYAGATTKQLAEAANISEMTLFRKYESKSKLVKKAILSIIEQTDFEAATQYTGEVAADLLRVVQSYQDSAVKHGQLIFILISELPRHPELADLLDMPSEIFSGIGRLLARYQSEGVLQSEPPLQTVAVLLGPLMYATMLRSALPNGDLPPLDLRSHVTRFLEGRRVAQQNLAHT